MKKFIPFLILFAALMPWAVNAQQTITIGTGTSTTYYTPFNSLYGYSFVEQLYTAQEIGMAGSISSISFNNSSTTGAQTNNITVYMKNVSRSSFSSTTDYEPVTAADIVYTGSWTINQGWNTINLDSPFFFDGSSNLLVAIHEYTSGYSTRYFYYTSTPGSVVLFYSDSYNPDPYNLGSYSGSKLTTANRANMQLEITPGNITCHSVGVPTVSNITPDNAVITWNASVDPGTHILQYKPSTADWSSSSVITEYPIDTTFDFNGTLTPMTSYDVRVAIICSPGDTSFWRSTSFTTACSDITSLPHLEGFDTYGTADPAYPTCWTKINTYSSNRPYVSSTHYEGVGSLYFYAGTSGTYNIAIMPAIDPSIPINTLQVNFMYRSTYNSDRLIVGIMDDPSTASSFVPVDTVYPATSYTTWDERTVLFDTYTGTGRNIAFKNEYIGSGGYGYMDNLVVEVIPTCNKPTSITLSNYTAAGCDVDWIPNGDETSWEVVAVPANADVNTGTPETAYSHPYTLTSLSDDTQYDVYVRAVCSGNDYSGWSFKKTFTTNPLCSSPSNVAVGQVMATSAMVTWNSALYGATGYTVGYSEAGQDNWTTQSVTGNSLMLSGLTSGTAYDVFVLTECDEGDADTVFANFQTHSCLVGGDLAIGNGTSTTGYLPEYSLYEYSYTQQIFLASELGSAMDISSIAFEVTTLADPLRNLQIYLMHTSSSSSTSWLSASQAQLVYSGNVTLTTGWNTFNFTSPFQFNGSDNLAVIVLDVTGDWTSTNNFSCHTTSASLSRYVYQDGSSYSISTVPSSGTTTTSRNNVIFGVPCDQTATCAAPNVYVDDVTENSITVAWAPGNMENSWELEYCVVGQTTWTTEGTVTSPYTISNLTPDTKYTVRVRALCGGGENSTWSGVSVRTACSNVTIPYTEDFEDAPGTGSGNMVTCWTTGSNYTSSHYPYTSSSQHHNGSYSAYFYGTNAYYSYMASPEFDENVDMTNLQVRFFAYKSTASYYIQVGIMTDPNDPNTFVQVGQDLTPSTTSTWEMLDVNTNNYTGTGRYIAFRIPAVSTSYMYVDDITVDVIPVCLHVNDIQATNITTTSADLSWTAGGDESEWAVVYGPAGSITNPDNETPLTTSGMPEITLSNLSPSTAYDVFVKAVCSPTESSFWWDGSFNTACGEIALLPFMENFDNMGSGSAVYPNCWMRHNNYSTTTNYPYVSTSYHNSGNASLYFYSSSTTYNYAVLPPMDVNVYPVNTLQVSFQMRSTSSATSSSIQVGVMTDSSDVSTFVPVQTVHNTTTSVFEPFEVPLTSYAGTGRFIALKLVNTSSTYSIYLDDLMVDLAPLCDKPTNVVASNLTATGADIDWMPGGSETDWELVVVAHGAAITSGTAEQVSAHPYTLTNLNDNTAYDVYVRADCGTGVDFSSWSQVCSFTTTPFCSAPTNVEVSQVAGTSALLTWTEAVFGATAYTIEYTETGTSNWVSQSVTGNSYMLTGLNPETAYTVRITSECDQGTAPYVTKNFSTGCLAGGELQIGNGTTTSYYVPLNNYYNYSYTQQIFLASELTGISTINNIAFQYSYSTPSSVKSNVSIYLAHTTKSSFSSTSDYESNTNFQLVYTGPMNCQQGWNTFNFTTPFQYNGTDNLLLVVDDNSGDYDGSSYTFYTHATSAPRSVYYYSDSENPSPANPTSGSPNMSTSTNRSNVRFSLPCDNTVTCIAPNVYVSDATESTLTLNWAPGYQETSWEIEISEDDSNWTSVGTVSSYPYTINSLMPSTLYYVRVRSVCGGGEYSSWTGVSERTECAPISSLPFMENFDSHAGTTSSTTNNLPYCWSYLNSGSTYPGYPIIYSSATYAASGNNSIRFYTYTTSGSYDDQIAILPQIDVNTLPINTLQLAFDARNYSTYTFTVEVGVMTDPANKATFMPISSITTTSNTYANYEIPLSQYAGTGSYIAIKAPKPTTSYNAGYIDNIVIEPIPACPKPTQVHATNVTNSFIELGWTENGSATSWVIEYGPVGFTIGNGTEVNASSNPFTVSGLSSSTVYDFYVKADCGGGEYSYNSSTYTFSTACDAINQLPYTENFDGTTGSTTTSVSVNNLPYCWSYLNSGTSTSYSGYPIVYTSATLAASGNNSMRFYTYTSSGSYDDQIAILPGIDPVTFPINTLQLSFDARNNSSYTFTLVIGVMSNPTDKTTFVPVDTIVTTTNAYNTYDIPLSHYSGNGSYIALMAPQPATSYNSGYVDNIVVDLMPSCPRPNDLHAVDATTSSIELGWTEAGSATTWEIAYGAPGFDLDDASAATFVTATSNPFVVTGLNNSTTYEFYVRALCSSTDVSSWSNSIQASSTMVPTSLPYTADFSANDAWVLNNGNCPNYWMKGMVSNEPALFVTSNGSTPEYTNSATSVAALKLFSVGTADSITITFDIMVDGEGSFDYFKLFLAPASQQFPASTTAPSSGDYGYNSYSVNAYNFYANGYGTQSSYPYVLNKLTSSIHVTATMPNPNANPNSNSTALLALTWKNDGSVLYNPPATITSLSVTADGSGPVVTNPTVATNAATAIATTSATLHGTITNPDNVTITAKGFQWKTTTGGTYTQIAGTGTGNGFTANLTNLTPNTSYTYKAFITYNGTTVYGNEMTFTTLEQGSEPCNTPTGLTAGEITGESIAISWNADPNVSSWNIQYRQTDGGQLSSATSNTNSYTIHGLAEGTSYQIQVQANCGDNNISEWSPAITVSTTGLENWLENSVNLYPNPAKEVVNVQCTMYNVQTVEVFDVFGKLITTTNDIDNPTRINVSGLADGMYFVRVTTEAGTVTKTFVKR